MKKKPDIVITPIFDQSVGSIWSDFARIEIKCDKEYGYEITKQKLAHVQKRNADEWETQSYTFAFGAYDGQKMVGFASGYREDKREMYLHNLYVDPDYKGIGIGKALLEQSERNASMIADTMTAISLSGALSFYEQRGYGIHDRRHCEKILSKEIIGVVPVFKSIGWLRGVKINVGVDIKEFKKYARDPMFAYVSMGREIDGIVVKMNTGETKIWTNPKKSGMKEFYEKRLLTAMEKIR